MQKFAASFRGLLLGIRGDSSFLVHLPAAVGVVAAGAYFQVSTVDWCLLVLCIAIVLAAELFNSALESLAKAVTRAEDPHVARALDIASGAVLMSSVGAAVVGLLIFVPRLATVFK
jgi:diacylglycerol kinase (ATP)